LAQLEGTFISRGASAWSACYGVISADAFDAAGIKLIVAAIIR
jgi:hypothetical protein